ncbi:hypothetical protein PTE30175_03582 [Pandoraea terrae]|uniref:Uncharacterized protein n=1 Tax=Pandoraea terrae TaxID=1537710 RepID=A0A5E4X5K1_9BURK|nr:hypothetical protein [Pandoraea terrae]VVE31566.1 hypothetical protein PTE30175_03582 [Pandoraea terrae]
MQMSSVEPVIIFVLLAAVVALLYRRTRNRREKPDSGLTTVPSAGQRSNEAHANPSGIAIVDAASAPLVTIRASDSSEAFGRAKSVSTDDGTMGRLSGLLQAAPSVLVASEASGKQLMEVVINGDLIRAADGNGLRAIAMGPDGIKEHARLFEVKNLQNMINAAAVWQIASVVVAQKHLADISKKLDEIKAGVQNLSSFLDEERRSRIEATYEYLSQAYRAIKAGELPLAIRAELESCERELLAIELHLDKEYRRVVEKKVKHTETLGTGDLAADIERKIDGLAQLGQDIELCLKTRIAAWHVLSLYPGEPQLKLERRASIERSIEGIESLVPYTSTELAGEIGGIKSAWNRESTLAERRTKLSRRRESAQGGLANCSQTAKSSVAKSSELLLTHDKPTRMWLEVEKGAVVGARIDVQ